MIITVVILIAMVQIVQSLGNIISAKLNKSKMN
jgi:ABC-type methionine transport system permease subunit